MKHRAFTGTALALLGVFLASGPALAAADGGHEAFSRQIDSRAEAYRAAHQADKALAVYRRGLHKVPARAQFAAGAVHCLVDLGRFAEAMELAEDFTSKHGDHTPVLLAGGAAAELDDEPVVALNFYQHAQAQEPSNTQALRGIVRSLDRMGAPHLALRTAEAHPGLLPDADIRALAGNADRYWVHWGVYEPVNEASRYAVMDQALASLESHISQWQAQAGPEARSNILRARFDRLIVLRDRQRMQDVVAEYQALLGEGVTVPAYALVPVGHAYLALRQPEAARDLFLKVLQADPSSFEARRLLSYAYLDCGDTGAAMTEIDTLRDEQPIWVFLKGDPERQPNTNRSLTELDSGVVRTQGGVLQQAEDRLTALVNEGPYDPRLRAAMGRVALARGLPRQAQEQFEIGAAIQDGRDVGSETGLAEARLALQNFPEAEGKTKDLLQRFPENAGVQRAGHLWDVHNRAELDIRGGYAFAPAGGAVGLDRGQGRSLGFTLYSAPLDYNWRLFAGQDMAHEREGAGQGTIDVARSSAGVEFRKGDVRATVAPTFNTYDSRQRVGADGAFDYAIDDQWRTRLAASLFSAATPLRALNAGITANRYETSVTWRQNESRQLILGASAMTFSDRNLRSGQTAAYSERLYESPGLNVDAVSSVEASQNNRDKNRVYFNPAYDLSALAGARGTQTLYRRYETVYEHSLSVMPGAYTQAHSPFSPAWLVRYEQRVNHNDTFNAAWGLSYAHRDYDGSAGDTVSLTFDVVERF